MSADKPIARYEFDALRFWFGVILGVLALPPAFMAVLFWSAAADPSPLSDDPAGTAVIYTGIALFLGLPATFCLATSVERIGDGKR